MGSRGFHCKAAKDLSYLLGKFENEIRRGPLDRKAQPMLSGLRLCQTVATALYILTYDVTHITPVVSVGAINTG